MPALSPTMTEGNLAKWVKKEGEKISAGEVIAEIETDKATMEIPAPMAGVVTELLVKVGDKVSRGSEILMLEAHQVVVVGDRPLTDIWAGQRQGSLTILVDPLIKHQENGLFKILRRLERLFVHSGSGLTP